MPQPTGAGPVPTRRKLLSAIGGTGLATGLAGCTDITSYSFSATPVRLHERTHAGLGVTVEADRGITNEYTRSMGDLDAEVTVESHFAAYATPGPVSFGHGENGGQQDSSGTDDGTGGTGPVDPGAVMAHTQVIGVLATPKASVAGRRLNPLADESVPDLVTGPRGRDLLARLGVDRTATVVEPLAHVDSVRPSDIAGAVTPSDIAEAYSRNDQAGTVTPSRVDRFVGAIRQQSGEERLVLASVGRREVDSDAVIVAGVQQVPVDLDALEKPYRGQVPAAALDASTGLLVALVPFIVPDGQSLAVEPSFASLGPGEYVSDRDDTRPDRAVSILADDIPSESWQVFRGETVTDQNPQYDPSEPVVVVAYEHRLDDGWTDWRTTSTSELFDEVVGRGVKFHAFPRARLRRHLLAPTRP